MPHRPSSLAGAWDAEAAARPSGHQPRQASGPLHNPPPYHDPEAPSAPPLATRAHAHSFGGALARYPAVPTGPPLPSRTPSVTALLARDPSRRTTMPNMLPTATSYTSPNPLPTINDTNTAACDQELSWDHENPNQQQRQTRTAMPGAAFEQGRTGDHQNQQQQQQQHYRATAFTGGAGTDGCASGSTGPAAPASIGGAAGPSARWSKPPLSHHSTGGAAFAGQYAASMGSGQGAGVATGRVYSFRTTGGAPPAAYVTRAASATMGGALGRSVGGGLAPAGETPGLTALSAASLNAADAVAPRDGQQQQQQHDSSGGRPNAPTAAGATLPYPAPVRPGGVAVLGMPVQGMSTADPRDGRAGPPGLRPGVAIGVPIAEGVASGMVEGVPVPVPLALAAGGLTEADVVATIEVASGRGRRAGGRSSSGGGGVTDGEEMAAEDEGGDGGGGGGDGPPAVQLPPEVRRRLKGHLGRHRMKSVRTWTHLSHCMARPRSGYWAVGTMLLLTVLVGVFLFMGAQYEFVRAAEEAAEAAAEAAKAAGGTAAGDPFTGLITLNGTMLGAVANAAPAAAAIMPPATGPRALGLWLSFWRNSPARTFSFSFLRTWGGRYAPDVVAGQWWRWVTGLLLHASPMHLVANLALLLVLSTYLETLYGFWRLLPVWLAAGLAGNFASAVLEAPCTLVVGASGCVFGLLGMYCADAALNWESIPLLWLRLGGVAGVVAFTVALQVTDSDHLSHGLGGVSHASHVAGFLAGGLLALAALPDFKARRAARVVRLLQSLGLSDQLPARRTPGGAQLYSFWQRHAWLTYCMYGISAAFLLAVLLAAPLVLYLHTFKRMECDA